MKKITIKEVAKEIGVSASTVSRVIREQKNVNPETRKRVEQAIREMGFSPDGRARSMVMKQSKTIGVSVADISNPFYPLIIRGIENTINKFGYNIILCNTDEDYEKEEKYLQMMLEKRVDGLIISPTRPKIDFLKMYKTRQIPIVCVDRIIENMEIDTVRADNINGAFMAVEYLIKAKHKNIGIITGFERITTLEERLNGYLMALDRYEIIKDKSLVIRDECTIEGGIKSTEKLMSIIPQPSAIFATNNMMVMGAYVFLKKAGIKIPKNVSIIGFDDFEWAIAFDPPLTTVYQPSYAVGSTAAQILINRLRSEGPKEVQNIILKTNLVIRKSVQSI